MKLQIGDLVSVHYGGVIEEIASHGAINIATIRTKNGDKIYTRLDLIEKLRPSISDYLDAWICYD